MIKLWAKAKSNLTFLINDLADECICDECGYTPRSQHVMCFIDEVKDDAKYQESFAEFMQDAFVWQKIAPDAMRDDVGSREIVSSVIWKLRQAWATVELSLLVDARMADEEDGYISHEYDNVDSEVDRILQEEHEAALEKT
jgi:hypothetical protein